MLRYSAGCCELFSKSHENVPRVSAIGREDNKEETKINEQSLVILEKRDMSICVCVCVCLHARACVYVNAEDGKKSKREKR